MIKLSKKSETKSKSLSKTIDLNRPYICEWCQRNFTRETTLVSHTCEPRRRWEVQHTAPVKLGFASYQMFYEHTSPPSTQRHQKSYNEFSSSKYYTSFVKFGHWLIEQRVLEIERFVLHLLKSKITFTRWCDRELYQAFITDTLTSETPESGLARSLKQITQWSEETGHDWQRFWLEVNSNIAVGWIVEGRISPWMLYNCDTAVSFLERLNSEQLDMIQKIAPARKWKTRLIKNRMQADMIKQTLAEAGM